jgi:hypothetical protein
MNKALASVFILSALAPLVPACSSEESSSNTGGAGGTGGSPAPNTGGTSTGGVNVNGGSPTTPTGGVAPAATGGVAPTASGGGTPSAAGAASGGAAGNPPVVTGGAPAAATGGSAPVAGAGGASAGASGAGGGSGGAAPSVCKVPEGAPTAQLITFNDNGGWCWYQDERVIVDTKNNRMIVGSMSGTGGRAGNVEAVVWDLTTKTGKNTVLNKLSTDDHNTVAFTLTGSGDVAAMWATHRENCNSYFATLDAAGTWSKTSTYSWSGDGCPWEGASTNMVTYANPWLMASENNRLYSGVRSVETSPAFLTSTDNGKSWGFHGRLTSSPQQGYVAGYYKYWGNGTDRIDWVGTDAHPRDADNSLWHGYIQGGKVYGTDGTVIDDTFGDKTAQNINKYTQVFKTGSTVGGVKLEHMWNHDIVRYADGSIVILGQGRVTGTGADDPDKRHVYSRWDGKAWTTTYLAKSGTKLYSDEQDYTGLSAADPDDPTVIYISTPFDPRDDSSMSANRKREIWRGTTCDNGKTFTWTPITQNSTQDNIRPVVPKWDAAHTAVLWMQGSYTTAQNYNMKIVGLVMER